jgi:hypothetical protein
VLSCQVDIVWNDLEGRYRHVGWWTPAKTGVGVGSGTGSGCCSDRARDRRFFSTPSLDRDPGRVCADGRAVNAFHRNTEEAIDVVLVDNGGADAGARAVPMGSCRVVRNGFGPASSKGAELARSATICFSTRTCWSRRDRFRPSRSRERPARPCCVSGKAQPRPDDAGAGAFVTGEASATCLGTGGPGLAGISLGRHAGATTDARGAPAKRRRTAGRPRLPCVRAHPHRRRRERRICSRRCVQARDAEGRRNATAGQVLAAREDRDGGSTRRVATRLLAMTFR